MTKEKVNYQEVYDLYQLCSETKDLRKFCEDYGVHETAASPAMEQEVMQNCSGRTTLC